MAAFSLHVVGFLAVAAKSSPRLQSPQNPLLKQLSFRSSSLQLTWQSIRKGGHQVDEENATRNGTTLRPSQTALALN